MGFAYSKSEPQNDTLSEKFDRISGMLEKFEERISQMEEKIKESSESLTNIHQKIKFLEDLAVSNEKKADQIIESHSWKLMNFFNDVEKFKNENFLLQSKFNCSEKKIKKSSKKLKKHSELYQRARISVKDAKLSANSMNRSSEFETDQNSILCDNISNLSIIL